MTKLEIVKAILQNDEISDWYATEHNVSVADLTAQSVRVYGTGGHGDVADQIIQDGLDRGLVTQADAEAAS